MKENITLDQLKPGETGQVLEYQKISSVHVRLRELGLTKGSWVKLERYSPLGDPIEISVRGSKLSIRKNDASTISILKSS